SVLDAEIRAHLEAENAHTKAWLADTEELQEALFAEMKGRIKEDDASVPTVDGEWAYYTRYETGQQYPLVCRMPRADLGPGALSADRPEREQVMLDGNKEADGKAYWKLTGFGHSPDHQLAFYDVDENGSEFCRLRVRNLATGEDLGETIEDVGSAAWSADSGAIVYVKVDENHRPKWVYRHTIGDDPANDTLVYEEDDPGFFVGVGKTQSGAFIEINVHRHECSEIRLLDAYDLTKPAVMIAPRRDGHEYDVEHQGDDLIVLTNSEGAVDFRLCRVPLSAPGEQNWQEIVAHRPGCLILSVGALEGHLVRLERENGLPRIVVRETASSDEHEIAFDEEAYSLGLSTGYEFDTTDIRFTYASMTTPSQVFDYDMATRARTLRKSQDVPSGHDPADYVTRRVMAPARDGETVPVSLLYRRDTAIDGSAPLFLYGYGSYGIAMPAGFSTTRLSLVDRGFVFAIAHVRGGKEKGYQWYLDGKRETKTNTFNDFVDAGRFLVSEGFGTSGNVVAQGGSAGGMLMGAVANQAPDLFRGIIADVPFVDVLNTMLDDTLPLTPPEWPEWGNPIESADDFARIRSYSPYDQVSAQAYPNILAHGGLTDPRVTYWEPAKWVARLRASNTGPSTILLKTNMDAGHGGASGRFEALRELAMEYAFAIKLAG
ncbi:MAG: S9 family peptidase, partial [Pseudomonadota bacterium]